MLKKILLYGVVLLMLFCSAAAFTGCGGSGSETEESTAAQEQTTKTTAAESEPTDETVHAADPMTDEEKATDDSGGCVEDSDDLLY